MLLPYFIDIYLYKVDIYLLIPTRVILFVQTLLILKVGALILHSALCILDTLGLYSMEDS